MWFLAGNYGGESERECTIPANEALFFPLINGWVIPSPETVDEPNELASFLNWAAGYFADGRAHTCELTLLIDGEPILPSGHWALLEPLPAGDYVLEFGGTICDGETIYFETHVTYTLHVEE